MSTRECSFLFFRRMHADSRESRRLFFSAVASQGGALIVAKAVVAPLDRLRMLRQLGLATGPGWHWRGCGTHLAQISISNAVRLLFVINLGERDSFATNWAACTAAVALTYPLDVRYTQRISGLACAGNFFSRNYAGFGYSLLTTPIFLGAALSAVHGIKLIFPEEVKKFPGNVASGACAGLIAGALTYPIDTLRRRSLLGLPRPLSFTEFFRGFGIHLAKSFPEYFILAGTYSFLANLSYI